LERPPARSGEHTDEALADWGVAAERIAALRSAEAIG
jgi:alpha-methylacyl-CoA racemase